jgi:tetratricopeptide (TPR) repeat protein
MNEPNSSPHSSSGWNRVASELRAYRDLQRKAWGDTDNALLGRYLADEVDSGEREKVEAALDEHPELRQLTDLVREVLGESDSAAVGQPEKPAVLPFAPPKVTAKRAPFRSGQAFGWLVAACLLVTVGTPLAGWLWLGTGHEPREGARLVSNYSPIDQEPETGKLPPKFPGGVPDRDPLNQAVAAAESHRVAEFKRWLNQGHGEIERQRFDEAARAFNQAAATIDLDDAKKADVKPELMFTPVVPGASGQPVVLREQAAKARQLASYSLNMHNGEAAEKQARYDEAVRAYSEALKCQPNDRLATVRVEKAKELASLHVVLKPGSVPPQRLEEAVGNFHPFAASLMKEIRVISEKGWSTGKTKERK